jgi:nicotinate-nucleotide adenylyltransferase
MIGVLGGTFDPVHLGHIKPALEVRAALSLKEVRLIPVGVPPHRPAPVASAEHRWRMLLLAVSDYEGLTADNRELRRPGPSYTVDTLRELRAELDEALCLLLGADAFLGFNSWRDWPQILRLANLVVVARPGSSMPAQDSIAELLRARRCDSSAELARRHSGAILWYEVQPVDISATAIRAGLARGKDMRAMLPEPVLRYIHEQGLYRGTA